MKFGEVIKIFKSDKGNSVVFRYPKKDDLHATLAYVNELIKEDTFIELSGKPLTYEYEKKWIDDLLKKMPKRELWQVIAEVNGVYAGNAGLTRGKYRRAHTAGVGISLAAAYRNEGIGTALFACIIDEARKLGLRLLELSCFENNPRALRLYEKFGFKKIGTIPGEIAWKGGFVGSVKLYLPLVK